MAFVSTSTEIALVDSRGLSGSVTLPLSTDIPGRIITVKDAFGTADFSTITLTTQGNDLFDDGTTAKTLAQEFANLTVFASTGRWFVTGGTVQNAFTTNVVTFSTIRTYNWRSLNSNYGRNLQAPAAIGQIALLDSVFASTTASAVSTFIEFGNLNPLQSGTSGTNAFRYLIGVERNAVAASNGLDFKIKRWTSFGSVVRPYGASVSSLVDVLLINSAGNVGIANSNPLFPLDVGGVARGIQLSTLSIQASSIGVGLSNPATGFIVDVGGRTRSQIVSTLTLQTSSIAVGASNALYTVDVNGIGRFSTLYVAPTTGTEAVTTFSSFGTAAQNVRFALAAGDAYKPTGTTWLATSDLRIKENIIVADLDICYKNIKDLPLRRFTYTSTFISETDLKDKRVLGFIAQEVSTIMPKAVVQTGGYGIPDLLSLNVDQLNMTLFGAVKKAIQDKEALESTSFSLQTLNDQLTTRISTLEGHVFARFPGGNV